MELNSSEFKQYPALPEHMDQHQITIGDKEWLVAWTRHARNRTVDRHSHPAAAAKVLDKILNELTPVFPQILAEAGTEEMNLRVFPYGCSFVLSFNEEKGLIYVITYGNVDDFRPKFGSFTVTMTDRKTVTARRWIKPNQMLCGDSNHGVKLLGVIA